MKVFPMWREKDVCMFTTSFTSKTCTLKGLDVISFVFSAVGGISCPPSIFAQLLFVWSCKNFILINSVF